MKTKLITLIACAVLFACLVPSAAFAQDGTNVTTLQAASSDLVAQDAVDAKCALLTQGGWLKHCDSDGNAVSDDAADWTASELGNVKKLFVSSGVSGLADYSETTAQLDYTHPRIHLVEGGETTQCRVGLAGEPTQAAPYVLENLTTLYFLLNANNVSKCSVIADGLFAGSGLARFDNLDKTSIVQIGSRAFAQCTKLRTNLKIPATCTSIGDGAFDGCTALKTVAFGKGVAKLGARAFAGCVKLEKAALPNACTSIGKRAFMGCAALERVSAGTSKKKVGPEAFSGCTALATASLGPCSSIGKSAFAGCTALSSVSMDSCSSIGDSAFAGCAKVASMSIGSCREVGDSAFAGCSALKSVDLSSCTAVGKSAFSNCASLGSVSLPSCITLGASAFEGCSSLAAITFGVKTKRLGSRALAGTKVGKLELPAKVKKLPSDLLGSGYTPLKTVILRSPSVVALSDGAVFANTPLAKKADKASRLYVPASLYKQYVKKGAANKWRKYRTKFFAMPEIQDTKVTVPNVTYNGDYQTPGVLVKYGKKTLRAGVDYSLSYAHNKDAGTAQVSITGMDIYYGSKTATFTIRKANNTLTVQNVTRYVTDTVVKKKGMTIYGATGVDGAQGKTTFKKLKKSSSALSIDASTGAVSIEKGTKPGSYKLKIKVNASGNNNYKAMAKKFTLTVKVASKEEVAKHHSAATFISIALSECKKWSAGKVAKDKYWKAFVSKPESWCSEFVGWCLRESGLVQGVTMPSNPSYARAYYNFYSAHPELATIHVNDGSYTPKPGDVVLQIQGNKSNMVHTEMVTWCDGESFGGVSGGSRVSTTSHPITNRSYYYFITIKWDVV